MEEFITELASNSYFIVGTGIVTILGFIISVISIFMVTKIYKIKLDTRIDEINTKIDNSFKIDKSKETKISKNKVKGDFAGRDINK